MPSRQQRRVFLLLPTQANSLQSASQLAKTSVSNQFPRSMEALLFTDPEGTKPTHPTQFMPRPCEASVAPIEIGPGDGYAVRALGMALQMASS